MLRDLLQRLVRPFRSPRVRRPLLCAALVAFGLRVLLFVARGDYLAFDEGWYLILAQNLAEGRGFTLNGWPHTVLSPLYPVLVAGLNLLGAPLTLAGDAVSALASAALVVPAYVVFRRMGGRVQALAGSWMVALAPSLMAFVTYFVGHELYVGGSEPLFHLALFAALAVLGRTSKRAAACGLLLACGYLARPEALLPAAAVGAWLVWPGTRSGEGRRRVEWRPAFRRSVVYGLGFLLVAAPYLGYLHQVTGQWTLTGRGVAAVASVTGNEADTRPDEEREQSARSWQEVQKNLLWGGSEMDYIRSMYSLDRTGLRMRSTYWGVRPGRDLAAVEPWEELGRPPTMDGRQRDFALDEVPSTLDLYGRTLKIVWPLAAWGVVLLGLGLARRRDGTFELFTVGTLAATSAAIAVLVHVDARNHLLLVPALSYYTGAGALAAGRWIDAHQDDMREGFFAMLALGLTGLLLVAGPAEQAWRGLQNTSPHHRVGTVNARVGELLSERVGEAESIMSWHPALAVYADRDWRVLPYEPLPQVLRYATHRQVDWLVLSALYPYPTDTEAVARLLAEDVYYLGLRLPDDPVDADAVVVDGVDTGGELIRFGRLLPPDAPRN